MLEGGWAMSHALVAFFRQVALFRSLDDSDLTELLRAIRPMEVAAGELIFRQDEAGDAAYAIQTGRVEILVGRGEREVMVAELSAGDVLGELALLDGSPRSASARAVTDVTLFRIDQGEFDFLRRNMRPAAYKIIRSISSALCERLRDTNERMRGLMSDGPGPMPPPLSGGRREAPRRAGSAQPIRRAESGDAPRRPRTASRPIKVTSARKDADSETAGRGTDGGSGLLGRLNFWSNK